MTKLNTEIDGSLTPESRAKVLSTVLCFMATVMQPVPYGAVLDHVIGSLESREEDVSSSVMHAVHELIIGGFLSSNGFHREENGSSMVFAAETVVHPSRKLTAFAYGEFA